MKRIRFTAAAMAAALALTSSVLTPLSFAAEEAGKPAAAEASEPRGVEYEGKTYFFVEEDGQDYVIVDGMKFISDNIEAVLISGADTGGDVEIPDHILVPTPPGIVTGEPVTPEVVRIADGAFRDNRRITSVKIPETVRRIGCDAFRGCDFLMNAELPETLTDIGGGAFADTGYADKRTEYDGALVINGTAVAPGNRAVCIIPEGTKRIADHFAAGSLLEYIGIPEGVTAIGESAFEGCQRLANIYLPKSLEKIGKNAFSKCYQRNVYYAGSENDFGNITAEDGNSMLVSVVPKNYNKAFPLKKNAGNGIMLSSYGYKAGVASCDTAAAGEVEIPESLRVPEDQTLYTTRIESGAFRGCGDITSVKIPYMVNYIAEDAFEGCTSLTDIYFDGNEERWNRLMSRPELPESITVHYTDERRTEAEVYGFDGKVSDGLDCFGEVFIGEEYREIDAGAFEGNRSITSVTLGQTVTSVGSRAFAGCTYLSKLYIEGTQLRCGEDAFADCLYLNDVYFSGSRHDWELLEGYVGLPEGVTVHCSDDAPDQPELVIEDGILKSAMYASGDVVIPDGVKTISEGAFKDNKKITSVTIPDSTERICRGAFSGCSALKTINAPDKFIDVSPWAFGLSEKEQALWYREQLAADETVVFCGCLLNMPDTEEYTVPDGVKQINSIGNELKKLKKLTVSEGVMFTGFSFNGCDELEELELPASLQLLEDSFNECGKLKKAEYKGTDSDWEKLGISSSLNLGKAEVWNGGEKPLVIPVKEIPTEPQTEPVTGPDYYAELNEDTEQTIEAGETAEIWIFGEGFTPVIRKADGEAWIKDESGEVIEYSFVKQEETVRGTKTTYSITAKSPGVRQLYFDMGPGWPTESPYIIFTVTEAGTGSARGSGDANCDGKVTVADAVAVLQYIANKEKYPLSSKGLTNADADGVKGITGSDATAIQKIDAGIRQ